VLDCVSTACHDCDLVYVFHDMRFFYFYCAEACYILLSKFSLSWQHTVRSWALYSLEQEGLHVPSRRSIVVGRWMG
jgi:hypothetical protein